MCFTGTLRQSVPSERNTVDCSMDWELVRTLRIKAPVALWFFPDTSSIGAFVCQSFGSAGCNRKSTAAITPFDGTADIHSAK